MWKRSIGTMAVALLCAGAVLAQDQPQNQTKNRNRQDQTQGETRNRQDQTQGETKSRDSQDDTRSTDRQQRARTILNRAYLGVWMETAPDENGALVRQVRSDSPAAKAGLMPGDIVTKLDNRDVNDPKDISDAVAGKKAGDKLDIHVERNGKQMTLHALLEQRPRGFGAQRTPIYGGPAEGTAGGANDQIQQLERRIRQLERRVRELEARQGGGGGNPRTGTEQPKK
jgi:hypothetical protein